MNDREQKGLFRTRLVAGKEGSGKLFDREIVGADGPVEYFGLTFSNDENIHVEVSVEVRRYAGDHKYLSQKASSKAERKQAV